MLYEFIKILFVLRHKAKKSALFFFKGGEHMKFYLNTDLPVDIYRDILNELLNENCDSNDFIVFKTLKNFRDMEMFVAKISQEENLVFYNYASLKITVKEFYKLYCLLNDKKISVKFFKENSQFLKNILHIARTDRDVLSLRIKDSIEITKKKGKRVGRPSIDQETRKEIYRLYHEKKYSVRQISLITDVSTGSVSKYIR